MQATLQHTSPNQQNQRFVGIRSEASESSLRGFSTMGLTEKTDDSRYESASVTVDPLIYLSDFDTPLHNVDDGKEVVSSSVYLTASDSSVCAEIQESGEKTPCDSSPSIVGSNCSNSPAEAENDLQHLLLRNPCVAANHRYLHPFRFGENREPGQKITDGKSNVVGTKPKGPNHLHPLENGKDKKSRQTTADGHSNNNLEAIHLNLHLPRSLEAPNHLHQFRSGVTQEPRHKIADGNSNTVNTKPVWQPQSEHNSEQHCETLFGGLFNFDEYADTGDHREFVLNSMSREHEDFIKSDSEIAIGTMTTQQVNLEALIVDHPHYTKIIMASVACFKVRAAEEERKQLDELASSFLKVHAQAQDQNLEFKFSSHGRDPRLDLCLEKYVRALGDLEVQTEKLVTSASTFCDQMKQNILIQCPELEEHFPKQSESDSVSDEYPSGKDVEKIIKEQEQANDSQTNPKRSALVLSDEQWKGAILAAYDPKLLKNLKMKHLKEGRKNAKLPESARRLLLDWWNEHHGNPYPTLNIQEEEKQALSKSAGLETDQINNWFINQRKRHCCAAFSENHKNHAADCYKLSGPRR